MSKMFAGAEEAAQRTGWDDVRIGVHTAQRDLLRLKFGLVQGLMLEAQKARDGHKVKARRIRKKWYYTDYDNGT